MNKPIFSYKIILQSSAVDKIVLDSQKAIDELDEMLTEAVLEGLTERNDFAEVRKILAKY